MTTGMPTGSFASCQALSIDDVHGQVPRRLALVVAPVVDGCAGGAKDRGISRQSTWAQLKLNSSSWFPASTSAASPIQRMPKRFARWCRLLRCIPSPRAAAAQLPAQASTVPPISSF